MGRKRNRRVPQVLRRVFDDRARALGDVILSLSSKSCSQDGECLCRGRGCVRCRGAGFLLRPEDGPDYRRLLERCFCVVSPSAPQLTNLFYQGEWTQSQIVRHVNEELASRSQSCDRGIILEGFGEQSRVDISVNFLCDSAWNLLLARIGESAMTFLLKYTSLFIPLPSNNHYQVTGLLLNKVLQSSDVLCNPKTPISPFKDRSLERLGDNEFVVSGVDNNKFLLHNVQLTVKEGAVSSFMTYVESTMDSLFLNDCDLHAPSIVCNSPVSEAFPNGRKRKRLYSWQRQRRSKMKNDFIKRKDTCPAVMNDTEILSNFLQGDPVFQGKSSDTMMKSSSPFKLQKCRTTTQSSAYSEKDSRFSEEEMSAAFNLKRNMKHLDYNMTLGCFNCLMLRYALNISEGDEIRKRHMFYNTDPPSSIFTRNHILNELKPNNHCAQVLLCHIFNPSGENSEMCDTVFSCMKGHCPSTSGSLYHSLLRILKTLIRNSRKCHFMKLLCKHCPGLSFLDSSHRTGTIYEAPEKEGFIGKKKTNEDPHPEQTYCEKNVRHQKKVILPSSSRNSYCAQKDVVSFIWAATRSIIPAALLGNHSNWRALIGNVSKFVKLQRFEKFSINQCINRLQPSKFSFLSSIPLCDCQKPNDDWICMKQKLLRLWIYWYFSHMVVPLLRAHFYVTETEFGKNKTLYYPKPLWNDMLAKTLTSLKENNYKPVDSAYLSNVISSRAFGFSRVRFLPKEKGMRLLANLKAPSKMWLPLNGRKFVQFRSVNSALHDVHSVLKKIKLDHPYLLGASVFDYSDVYHLLREFLSKVKYKSMGMTKLYIVVADVSKAFDSIDQDKLLDVMKDVITKDEYFIRKYAHIVCNKKIMCTRYGYTCLDNDIASSLATIRSSSSHGIIADQGIVKRLTREKVHNLLGEHVKNNLLQLGKEFCVQKSGISQGSLLSSLLCSFYLGHVERNIIFPFLERIPNSADVTEDPSSLPHYTLLRLVDDFLFISTSEEQASGFFNRIRRGFREFNCYMNREKFGLNFELAGQRRLKTNRRYVGADGIPFLPWSGLLINCLTLEIQADYTRYMGTHIRSTITVHVHSDVEEHLIEKLCNYMRPKCHPLFYDSNINSPEIVRLNLYQAFLFCAMKFHSYFCALPGSSPTAPLCLHIITESFSYMHRLIKKRIYGMARKMEKEPVLRLKKAETVWLGMSAYIRVLRKKQTRHKELLSLLHRELQQHSLPRCNPSHLSYAIDDSHSSLFWVIKF